jgi:hypothetical protein
MKRPLRMAHSSPGRPRLKPDDSDCSIISLRQLYTLPTKVVCCALLLLGYDISASTALLPIIIPPMTGSIHPLYKSTVDHARDNHIRLIIECLVRWDDSNDAQ